MISLPFNLNPIIKAYHPEAYLSGIIFSKDLKYYPYLLSHYIQLIYYANWEESGTRLNYNNRYENWMFTKDGLITLNMLELPGFMFTSKSFDICDIVISSLKAGYYMMGLYDEYYIPDKSSYNKFHFDHDYIIYGADTENKQFLSAGYLKNGFYQPYKINFNHFIKSIIVSDGRIHMWPIKFNNSIDLDINLALIKESLYKYIFSQPNSRMESDFFGICACHALLNHCIDTINHKLNLDIRSIYAFAEHKKFMLARFKYLKENIHISINDNILAFLEYIYENSQIVLKLSMRFNLVFDATIGERIINYIQDSISMEEKILPDLLTCF